MKTTLAVLAVLSAVAGCTSPAPAHQVVSALREAGSWHGTGNMTVGDVVNTAGHFVITWDARSSPAGTGHDAAGAPRGGRFRLTVHSAVSGRPLRTVVDQEGEGHGTVDFEDDPRVYQFMVESANLEWSFTVNEVIGVDAPPPVDP